MKIMEYPDAEMMSLELAQRIAGELTATLEHEERALLVVPGGTTPGQVFDVLCAARLPWERVDIALSDERWRPEEHVRSNTRLVRQRLMVERAAAATYLPLYARADTPEEVLPELESNLVGRLPISVMLLGMGTDLHVASLFPGADNIALAMRHDAPLLVPMRVPSEPEPRVTMSARVLDGALSKHLVITGEAKRAALERAAGMTREQAPVSAVLDGLQVHWAP